MQLVINVFSKPVNQNLLNILCHSFFAMRKSSGKLFAGKYHKAVR